MSFLQGVFLSGLVLAAAALNATKMESCDGKTEAGEHCQKYCNDNGMTHKLGFEGCCGVAPGKDLSAGSFCSCCVESTKACGGKDCNCFVAGKEEAEGRVTSLCGEILKLDPAEESSHGLIHEQ